MTPTNGGLPNIFIADMGTNNNLPQDVVSLRLDPEDATIVSVDGENVQQDFRVYGVREDGSEQIYPAVQFAFDTPTLGAFDVDRGTFVSNGIVGGVATVTATADNGELPAATTTLTVQIERAFYGPQAPRSGDFVFRDVREDATQAANIVYPLDGALMPQNVFPANVQWERGNGSDGFRIRITKPHATITAYLRHNGTGFQNNWLVDAESWRSIAQSDPDDSATLTVDRWVALTSTAYSSPPVSIRFARAALSGAVYYWDIGEGKIIRINDGTGVGESFLPNPPVTPDGSRCIGCHSVSNSGQHMVGRLGSGDNVGAVFDLTLDLSGNPAPTVYPVDVQNGERWWASAWNPADTRIIVSQNEPAGGFQLLDPFTGARVPFTGSLPSSAVTQPAWSPDDSLIAYVSNIDDWGGAMTAGDISVIAIAGPDSFGPPQTLVSGDFAGSDPPGNSSSYPTWTPDSQRIAFAHGGGARSDIHSSALYMMDRDGSNIVRLDAANGGEFTSNTYQPKFSPFDQGGYYWMMFLSRRDYGNAAAGTRGASRQQLWVTAISQDAAPGEDPSHVPYWLPGQRVQSLNISGYWAPRPCREDGVSCSVGSECCGGTCARDPNSNELVCSPPPPNLCRELLQTCNGTSDCCEADPELVCIDNVCQRIVN